MKIVDEVNSVLQTNIEEGLKDIAFILNGYQKALDKAVELLKEVWTNSDSGQDAYISGGLNKIIRQIGVFLHDIEIEER